DLGHVPGAEAVAEAHVRYPPQVALRDGQGVAGDATVNQHEVAHGRGYPATERVVGHGLAPQDDAGEEAQVAAPQGYDLAHAVAAPGVLLLAGLAPGRARLLGRGLALGLAPGVLDDLGERHGLPPAVLEVLDEAHQVGLEVILAWQVQPLVR